MKKISENQFRIFVGICHWKKAKFSTAQNQLYCSPSLSLSLSLSPPFALPHTHTRSLSLHHNSYLIFTHHTIFLFHRSKMSHSLFFQFWTTNTIFESSPQRLGLSTQCWLIVGSYPALVLNNLHFEMSRPKPTQNRGLTELLRQTMALQVRNVARDILH